MSRGGSYNREQTVSWKILISDGVLDKDDKTVREAGECRK